MSDTPIYHFHLETVDGKPCLLGIHTDADPPPPGASCQTLSGPLAEAIVNRFRQCGMINESHHSYTYTVRNYLLAHNRAA